ncbi:MAG: hypothetical protein PW786_00150 [Arachidicoccus sp.]|nr:hypothetical protein [Arachidicoccus sp.]
MNKIFRDDVSAGVERVRDSKSATEQRVQTHAAAEAVRSAA